MKPLDPFGIDLEKTTLIEASAGTGKTYTITTLYCRLVAQGYPVESILVVTFTESAAAELKLRIRSRLLTTLQGIMRHPHDRSDELADFFCSQAGPDQFNPGRIDEDQGELKLICRRLQLAVVSFDQASILTIHSFCLKVLKENAFESHSLFDIELVPDRSLFLRQVSYDFFMAHVIELDTLFLSFLNQEQITPETFAASFGSLVSRSDLVCKPSPAVFEDVFDDYRLTLGKIHDILLNRSGEIIQLIQGNKGIDKRSYSKKNVPAWLDASLLKLAPKGVNTLLKMREKGDALYNFTRTRIALKTKTGEAPPKHELFDFCDHLLTLFDTFGNNLIRLKIDFLIYFNSELEKTKKTDGICFFDDLVNDLAAVLETQDAMLLKKAVRQTYSACLIDEFQDTDPRQYDIFSIIFSSENTPFFMIGDPKQAIYGFRGGDIFAYLKASRQSDQRFTLEKNYRSAPLLVEAVNEIFLDRVNPFIYEPIEFSRVTAPASSRNRLVENDKPVPPLQFCFIKREKDLLDRQGFISKDTSASIIPMAVASDILSLFESNTRLAKPDTPEDIPKKINPEDIAVLVRTNKQAELIQQALSRLNIPSYLSKSGSVFDSAQAIDLHDILWAVNNPDNKGFINAALCTSVFNYSSEMIEALDQNPEGFFKLQDLFREYKDIWESRGFVSMIMALFHSEEAFLKSSPRLDERAITNFYHLVELISNASLKQQLSPYYLMKWYCRQLFKDLRDDASDELRLQSDKKAVAIVTIHKSKGLEYPVVYLPYLWEGPRKPAKENILFHDPEKENRLTLDLGSRDLENSKTCFEKEEKAELRRLLYVALTRASALCRIIWGGFKSIDTSALGSLLHPAGCKQDDPMINDLEQLMCRADKSILAQPCTLKSSGLFVDTKNVQPSFLSASKTSREIKPAWKMSSFTGIIRSPQTLNPEHLRDRKKSGTGAGDPEITLADFPKGAGTGDLFHLVFEKLDFTGGLEHISQTVQSLFHSSGFSEPEQILMGKTAVKEVLGTFLQPGHENEPEIEAEATGFCLKDITLNQRFNEMEFTFPVNFFQMSSVKKIFEQSDLKFKVPTYLNTLSLLTPQSFKGFLKGFIDLVICHKDKWYVLDYKSNYLGDTYNLYSNDTLLDAMAEHHYFLQYHLYCVALHRYLGLRLKNYDYNTHFGGIFYLFIRGMHPEFSSKYGVFYDRPTKETIQNLSNIL